MNGPKRTHRYEMSLHHWLVPGTNFCESEGKRQNNYTHGSHPALARIRLANQQQSITIHPAQPVITHPAVLRCMPPNQRTNQSLANTTNNRRGRKQSRQFNAHQSKSHSINNGTRPTQPNKPSVISPFYPFSVSSDPCTLNQSIMPATPSIPVLPNSETTEG